MADKEYVVTEHFLTHQGIYVRASSKIEALTKVQNGIAGYIQKGDIYPKRAMGIHDVRLSDENLTCEICGGPAAGYPWGNRHVTGRCFTHALDETDRLETGEDTN